MMENNRMDFQKGIGEIMHELGEDGRKGLAKQGSFSWKVDRCKRLGEILRISMEDRKK